MFENIAELAALAAVLIGFMEWRYHGIHNCLARIESRLDTHIDKRAD